MNVSYVVIICFTTLFVLSVADDGKPIQKRILKLKNVNFNKAEGKPKSTKKSQKNKTIFVLSNPVIYPQKLFAPKPSETKINKPASETVIHKPTNQFDFLNFDAYILKPRNINYTALLSNSNNDVQGKESQLSPTTNYPQNEFLDFARAEPLIQTTVPTTLESIPYETTPYKIIEPEIRSETTTPKVNSLFPLGLAYFDSLRKYRKAFDSLQKRGRTKKPRIKTTSSTTTSTTAKTTETEEPLIETTTAKEYGYMVTPNYDEDLYEEPRFESYRYKPRYHNYEDEIEKNRHETTTRYLDYETLDRDYNHYESTETIRTTTTKPPKNSARRKLKNNKLHSSNVKSNFLYDRHINYPQEDESRRVVSIAKLENYKDKRSAHNNTETVNKRGAGGTGGTRGTGGTGGAGVTERTGDDKKHINSIPMQRHYFQ